MERSSDTLAVNCLDENRQSIDGREFPYLKKIKKKKKKKPWLAVIFVF